MRPEAEIPRDIASRVSRETAERLVAYIAELRRWQAKTNLVSPDTLPEIWTRHVRDSLQLLEMAPEARHWVDLGSGGGFPGLVIACVLAERPDCQIDLVESNLKKASFLRHVATSLELPAKIHAERIEAVVPWLDVPDVVTARALASLTELLAFCNSLLKSGAVGLFPKGRDHARELTEARQSWHFSCTLHPSETDPAARILEVRMA